LQQQAAYTDGGPQHRAERQRAQAGAAYVVEPRGQPDAGQRGRNQEDRSLGQRGAATSSRSLRDIAAPFATAVH
jgi:hypothetical protein